MREKKSRAVPGHVALEGSVPLFGVCCVGDDWGLIGLLGSALLTCICFFFVLGIDSRVLWVVFLWTIQPSTVPFFPFN